MTEGQNPQLSAAARVVVDAAKLAGDEAVEPLHRYMTMTLIIAEIVMLQQSVLAPDITAPPDARKAATLAAVVANVIDRLRRTVDDALARQLLGELATRISFALAQRESAIAEPTESRRH